MVSWRRRRGEDDPQQEATTGTDGAEAADGSAAPEGAAPDAAAPQEPGAQPAWDRSRGPFDASEAPELPEGAQVDLGALLLPALPGMELRLEVEEGSRRVVAATLGLAGSTAQVQVFAAPRTAGIWDEVRAEIAESVTRGGGAAQEAQGSFGRELLARVPARLPDGRTGHRPARFVGVDGPRWFLRAVISGPAVSVPEAAAPIEALLRACVVVRGTEAMAPRDLLVLKLPTTGVTAVAGTPPPGAPGPGPRTPAQPAPAAAPEPSPGPVPEPSPQPLDRPGE